MDILPHSAPGEFVEQMKRDGTPLPPATAGRARVGHWDASTLKAITDAQPFVDHSLVDEFNRKGRP